MYIFFYEKKIAFFVNFTEKKCSKKCKCNVVHFKNVNLQHKISFCNCCTQPQIYFFLDSSSLELLS